MKIYTIQWLLFPFFCFSRWDYLKITNIFFNILSWTAFNFFFLTYYCSLSVNICLHNFPEGHSSDLISRYSCQADNNFHSIEDIFLLLEDNCWKDIDSKYFMSLQEIENIYSVLSAILNLTNITFEYSEDQTKLDFIDPSQIECGEYSFQCNTCWKC